MKRLILVFFLSIFLIACNKNASQKGIIEPEKMVPLLTDMHLVDGYLALVGSGDSSKQVAANYYYLVYKKHKTDSTQFRKSLEYYSMRPKLLDTMYSQVSANLEKLQKKEEEKMSQERLDEESYNELKNETKGTLFKPYDIWFFKFRKADIFKDTILKNTVKTDTSKLDTTDKAQKNTKPTVKSAKPQRLDKSKLNLTNLPGIPKTSNKK